MGLSAVAITDHDTVDGIQEALSAGERLGFTVVPGVEITLEHQHTTMDMLGYFLDGPPSHTLRAQLAELRRYRDQRNARILERLAEIGMPIDPQRLSAVAGDGAVGRPHIGLAMVQSGYVDSVSSAFRLYLGRGGPAWVDRRRLSLRAAVQLLRESDGLAVLAHPGIIHTEFADLESIVHDAVDAGIVGLECYHPAHSATTVATCLELAAHHNLAVTGGSDFHGTLKPNVRLGCGPNGMVFADEILAQLAAASTQPPRPRDPGQRRE